MECEKPNRGVWGGNPKGMGDGEKKTRGVAQNTAFVERDANLLARMLITKEIPTLKGVEPVEDTPAAADTRPPTSAEKEEPAPTTPAVDAEDTPAPAAQQEKPKSGCNSATTSTLPTSPASALLAALLVLGSVWLRRRRA